MNETYLIPAANLPAFEVALAKLNKRAAKLGVPAISYSTSPAYREHEYRHPHSTDVKNVWGADHLITWNEDNRRVVGETTDPKSQLPRGCSDYEPTGAIRDWLHLTVSGESPKFDGWKLTGVLSPVPVGDDGWENLVKTVPGCEVPAEFRTRVGECDHCRTIRNRSETFSVLHDSGETKLIGRNCLKDFLGHADPHALAKAAELLWSVLDLCGEAESEGFSGGGWVAPSWTLDKFLATTDLAIEVFGWCSRGEAKDSFVPKLSTADAAMTLLLPARSESARELHAAVSDKRDDPTHAVAAASAIEWAKSIEADNDYLRNVNLIARSGIVDGKTAGIAASIIVAWKRSIEAEINRKRREERPESEHVGTVGKRIELIVTCDSVFAKESAYGVTGIHKLVDEHGNDITWFASGSKWLDEGRTYKIKATVKRHDEYRGRNCTIVTRLAVVEELETVEV